MRKLRDVVLFALFGCLSVVTAEETSADKAKYGQWFGDITTIKNGVKGKVYAMDNFNLFIRGFSYDNKGVDAFFYIINKGHHEKISIIDFPAEESGKGKSLEEYNNEDIKLALQDISKIEVLSVRSRTNNEEYGTLTFASDIKAPEEINIDMLLDPREYSVKSGTITIKDAKTLVIKQFHYDGTAPQAYFFVGNSTARNNPVTKVPNEKGSYENINRKYDGEDITVKLPGDLNVYNIKWLSMWCEKRQVELGHVVIPKDLNVPPYTGNIIAGPPPQTETLKDEIDTSGSPFLHFNFILCAVTFITIAYLMY